MRCNTRQRDSRGRREKGSGEGVGRWGNWLELKYGFTDLTAHTSLTHTAQNNIICVRQAQKRRRRRGMEVEPVVRFGEK